jgi:hypothetical protein
MTEEKVDRGVWVYDIETLLSCFTYTAYNIDTGEIVQYVVHRTRNDLYNLIKHLKSCKGHIGFNNINFDYPVIHYILTDNLLGNYPTYTIIANIYAKAQSVINDQSKFGPSIRERDVRIRQLDLFRLWHFNNKARMQSLKGLEIAMNYPNVMEMPIHHSEMNVLEEQIDSILEYNLNDVMATYEFYKLSLDKIKLRLDLNKKYNLACTNFPDSKIGERLVLKLYSEVTGLDIWEVNKMRSERLEIDLGACLFDYIKFGTKEFNDLLGVLRGKKISETKGVFEESVIYKGFKYDYGLGGIHGCIKPGIYESDEDYIIRDADVSSLYPSIAVVNGLYPEHLGPEFCKVYEDILNQRLEAKKSGDMVMSDGFKLALNSVYGKSNDKHSFLYDPLYTMKTTLNGQLMLSMLCESLATCIPNIQILQVNTDGVTVRMHKHYIKLYTDICKQWEKDTKLTLEYVDYSKMIIRDVNNYIAVKEGADTSKYEDDGVSIKGVKYKGAFEVKKDYHKDNSFMIIPIALSEYFVKGVPIEDTIFNHRNIYHFCGRQKFIGKDYGVTYSMFGTEIVRNEQQKVTRYYISNRGCSFVKMYGKGSSEVINKGYVVTIFNKYHEEEIWKEYDVNRAFYNKECRKEINQIMNKQLEIGE